jgi:hypothetical protein
MFCTKCPHGSNWESRIGRRLKLRDLHILSCVVDCGSMSKGAAQLGLSQPAVSDAITNLEGVVGVRLLDRGPSGSEPTTYAQVLLKRGHIAFDEPHPMTSTVTRGCFRRSRSITAGTKLADNDSGHGTRTSPTVGSARNSMSRNPFRAAIVTDLGDNSRPGLPKISLVARPCTQRKPCLSGLSLSPPDGLQLAAFHLDQHSAKCWMAVHGTHGPDDLRAASSHSHLCFAL